MSIKTLLFYIYCIFFLPLITQSLVFRPEVTQEERDHIISHFPRFYEWSGAVLIDPSWIIGTAPNGISDNFTYNGISYQVQRHYNPEAPNIVLCELDKPLIDPQGNHLPLYRYRGREEDSIIWIFGNSVTNKPGQEMGVLSFDRGKWLAGTNRIEPFKLSEYWLIRKIMYGFHFKKPQNPHITKYEAIALNKDEIVPNLINIADPQSDQAFPSNYNDFWNNFRLCGIPLGFDFKEVSPYGYIGLNRSIRLADPRIQLWIDNLMIARALNVDFPDLISLTVTSLAYNKECFSHAERENIAIMIAPQWFVACNDGIDHKALWIRMSQEENIPDQKINIEKNLKPEHQNLSSDFKLIKIEKPIFPVIVNKSTGEKELFAGYKKLSASPTYENDLEPHITQNSVGTGTYLPMRKPLVHMKGKGALSLDRKNRYSTEYFDQITVASGIIRTKGISDEVNAWISNTLIKDALEYQPALN